MTTSRIEIDKKQNTIIIVSLYLFYLLGFLLNEDSNGGASVDYDTYRSIINNFVLDFKNTFLNYDKFGERHSPVLIMILSLFYKLNIEDYIIRLVSLNLSIISIIFFYKCLILKFKKIDNNYLILISTIFFLSPAFRSLSIWPDSRIFGFHFFVISVYYFLKFTYFEKKVIYCYLNIIFLAISSYFSPNFSLFAIFFLYKFYNNLKYSREFLLCVILNFVLALPAFYYLFILKVFFLTSGNTPELGVPIEGGWYNGLNYANKILIISTLIMFYFLPITINKKKLFLHTNKIGIKETIFLTLFFLLMVKFFNYQLYFTGGGIFLHLSHFLFKNNLLFYLISLYSILLIYKLCDNNKNNFYIIIIILLSNPQLSLYHKYFDPLIIFLIFTLFDVNFNKMFFNYKKISLIYIFYLTFLIISLVK